LKASKELIECPQVLFEADICRIHETLSVSYTSGTLICELADKKLVEDKLLIPDGGILRLTCEVIKAGKIQLDLVKKLVNFLYVASKMSQRVAESLHANDYSIIKSLTNLLIQKQLGGDLEFQSIVAGLIFSIRGTLEYKEDDLIMKEILNITQFIINKSDPYNDLFNNVLKEEQDVKYWTVVVNANTIALEVLSELFTSEDPPEEEVKMDCTEELKTRADSILDEALINSVIRRCEKKEIPQEVKEAGQIQSAIEKMRIESFGCLLNFVINKSQELLKLSNTSLANLIYQSIKELSNANSHYLFERISTFTKVSLERLGSDLDLSSSITEHEIQRLCNLIQTITSETIQLNLISILGCILKYVPHTIEQNKVCFSVLSSFAIKGSLSMVTTILNALFDIYSEETYNSVLKELNVISLLGSSMTHYKNMVIICVR